VVAARAAVCGALVPAPGGQEEAREAAAFVADLCKYPAPRRAVAEARRQILAAHARRLTAERGERVTVEATNPDGFDPIWLRNAVEEPLDEADVGWEG
jgi:hypothetical protein